MWSNIVKFVAGLLVDKVWKLIYEVYKEWRENRETIKVAKSAVKELKASKTPEEIRAALRKLNP